MFDDLTKNPANSSATSAPSAAGAPPRPNAPQPIPPVEDIYSNSQTALGAVNRNTPRPAVFQPKPMAVNPPREINFEDEDLGTSGAKKKIFLLLGVLFGLFAILLLGYLVFAKFLKPNEQLSSVISEVPTTTEEIITSTATTSVITEPVYEPTADNDSDGLNNEEEKVYGTNLNMVDSDEDGLSDRDEIRVYKTDPLNADTDNDGFKDGEEVRIGNDPKGTGRLYALPGQSTSTPVTPEPPAQPLKEIDTDKDNLSDEEERALKTDPLNADTDNDGLSDYDEVRYYKTNPLNSDSDGDGYFDGVEVSHGFNPLGAGKLEIIK
jgi:hypothetical protein